jgi:hypothetical protein
MSGQPLRHPGDASKFRKAYLATLQLQSELNKKNLDANALYRRTGVVPTQITDYRTTSEKMADLINLRILIRAHLRQIADAQNAEDIAQSLTADELVFASQSIDFLIKELKPKFKFGILKDIFLQYLRKYMSNEQSNQLAKVGLAPPGPEKQAPDLEIELPSVEQLIELEKVIAGLKGLDNATPAQDDVKKIIKLLNYDYDGKLQSVADADTKRDVRGMLENMFENVPSKEDIQDYIDSLEDPDEGAKEDMLAELIIKLTPVVNETNVRIAERVIELLEGRERTYEESVGTTAPSMSVSSVRVRKATTKEQLYQLLKKYKAGSRAGPEGIITEAISKMNLPELEAIMDKYADQIKELEHRTGGPQSRTIQGRGVGIDYSKGIDPLPKFAPIGNYFINLQKLKDDIVTCCRPNGKNVSEWKSIRVSLPLANVIRKLVNKGKPTFDEMSELSEEDKALFAEFIRKAKLEIDIPSSKIDREDLNQFEIMKGQIMAGNTNTEYIKKFKLLIVKLMHQGRLPKGQGKGILVELTELGY